MGDVLQPDGPCPAPVPVHDHADVLGDVGAFQRVGQTLFVDMGEYIADLLARPHAATLGPAVTPGPAAFRTSANEYRNRPPDLTGASG
jgi:hypothetical protein